MIDLSVVIPTYCREDVLVSTIQYVLDQMAHGDELLIIDQTPEHKEPTRATLQRLAETGAMRWIVKRRPGQVEAMNLGSRLARNEGLVFLDDDVVPSPTLLAAFRSALSEDAPAPAFCGQVLQPWHEGALSHVGDRELDFDPAFNEECNVLCIMEGNFAMRRHKYLELGGMDEHFSGCTYRHGTELAYRLLKLTGTRPRFLPQASLRHLYANGGQRAHGPKDSWGHAGASVGDYYFALTCLGSGDCVRHSLTRWRRAAINHHTISHPWLMPSMAAREMVSWVRAAGRAWFRQQRYVRPLDAYDDWSEWHVKSTVSGQADQPVLLSTTKE